MNRLIDKVQAAALDLAMDYVLRDPAHNFAKLVEWAERFDVRGEHAGQIAAVRPVAEDPENNWNKFVVKLCEEVDHEVLKATVRNFFVNASLAGMRKQEEAGKSTAAISPGPSCWTPRPPATSTAPAAGQRSTATS